MLFGYSHNLLLSNDTQLIKQGDNMEKLTPKEWRIKTCLDIQKRKAKTVARKKKADMEARQVLITRSVNARTKHYKSNLR